MADGFPDKDARAILQGAAEKARAIRERLDAELQKNVDELLYLADFYSTRGMFDKALELYRRVNRLRISIDNEASRTYGSLPSFNDPLHETDGINLAEADDGKPIASCDRAIQGDTSASETRL